MDENSLRILAEGVAENLPMKELLARIDEKAMQAQADELIKNPTWVPVVLDGLFGKTIPIDRSFYERLSQFARPFGFGEPSMKLIATVWLGAMKGLTEQEKSSLLDCLLDTKNNNFWRMLGAFPFFLSEAHPTPLFLVPFLSRMGEKIGADLGGGPFFRAVESFGVQVPTEAHELLTLYIRQELPEVSVHIAAILLGSVRAAARSSKFDSNVVDETDKLLMGSLSLDKRICYHRSWGTSFSLGVVTSEELSQKLDSMLSGSPREHDEAFRVMHTCVLSKREDEDFSRFSFDWLTNHLTDAVSSWGKYFVVDSIWILLAASSGDSRMSHYESIKQILIMVQPISSRDLGTWQQLEYVLVEVLHRDKNKLIDLFLGLYEANPKGIADLIENNKLEYIESEMKESSIGMAVYVLLFSDNEIKRKLGMLLFRWGIVKLGDGEVPKDLLPDLKTLQKALLEFISRPMLGDEASDFLLAMLPFIESLNDPFKDEFEREMVLQAINYPGACLSKWKQIEAKSEILGRVIKHADDYFEKLNAVKDSPAHSFTFSDFTDAANRGRKAQSRSINEGIEEQSVLLRFVTRVNVLYGDKWATYIEGRIGDPTGFGEISHYVEYPRLEEIDPEGMAIRRLEAIRKLAELRLGNTSN
jgi:hypothetical protein